ncbi:MAG: hypothetical protein CMJ32_11100 [Phycisphaerae bacterium]|nr:hypothetical protein [Phycisphaerae bacterium]
MVDNELDMMIGSPTSKNDPKAAEGFYNSGMESEEAGDRFGAIESYRQAVENHRDTKYLFKLACQLDMIGEDDEAYDLYEEICSCPEAPVHALINFATMLEDQEQHNKAERLLETILQKYPNHPRARLFLKDVLASKDMYYDEEHLRDQAKRNALLDTPVTDFELSVRARNCLKKMQIRTLGDLLKISEAELLSYKNFGETSLVEIKAMLAQKGLRLGQGLESGQYARVRREIYDELKSQASEAVLNKPISVLELSVRARKALQLLNIQTIGELASRTEAELMGVKNFGATSLEEIGEKLGDYGLSLRTID